MAAFLFDMDGLLLDTERLAHDAFLHATQSLGIASDRDTPFFLSLVGCSTHMTNACLGDYLPGHVTPGAFLEVWDSAAHARLEAKVPLRPYAEDVVSTLHGGGWRLAVVTSSPGARARAHLERAGLLHFFEAVTGGDEVSANKPDPAPYVETARRLGVDPAACYAFEDSDRGIASAVAAGCIATQIPDLRPHDVPMPALGQRHAPDLRAAMMQLGFWGADPGAGS